MLRPAHWISSKSMTCQSGGKTGRGYLWMSSLRGGSHTHRISVSQRSLGPSPSTWLANPVVSQDLSAPGPLLAIRMKPRANDSELFIPLFCTRELPLFDSIERKKIDRLTPTWNSILLLLVMAPYVGLHGSQQCVITDYSHQGVPLFSGRQLFTNSMFFIQGTKHLQPKGVASSKNEYRAETARRYIGQNVFVFCKLQKHV